MNKFLSYDREKKNKNKTGSKVAEASRDKDDAE